MTSHILSACSWNSADIPDANHHLIQAIHKSASKIEKWVSYHYSSQQALKLRFQELKLEHTFPCHPQTPKEVKALDEAWIRHYHKNYDSSLFSKDVQKAFLGRFFQLDLEPPGIASYKTWTKAQLDAYSLLEVSLPTNKYELSALGKNQKQWIFPLALKSSDWKSLSFPVQSLICHECFNDHTSYALDFTIPTFQVLDKTIVWKEVGQQLHRQLKEDQEAWKKLPLLVQWKLNKKAFSDNSLPKIPYTLDPTSFEITPAENIREYHEIFKKKTSLWDQLSYEQQVGFNVAFKLKYKDELPLKAKPVVEPPPRKKYFYFF
ncbi:hypothetical protein [Simkania sp.]|uniref:hypothetical protein n=1 Tax=Simkania sp. TaxID=34094 RepID=UPI003B527C49